MAILPRNILVLVLCTLIYKALFSRNLRHLYVRFVVYVRIKDTAVLWSFSLFYCRIFAFSHIRYERERRTSFEQPIPSLGWPGSCPCLDASLRLQNSWLGNDRDAHQLPYDLDAVPSVFAPPEDFGHQQ